jgi:hypothetical protein
MSLTQIKYATRRLSLARLRKLDQWLHELIDRTEKTALVTESLSPKRTASERTLDKRTYRLESILCGKENCKCARGQLHGPYWYSHTRVKDKVISQYIGKTLPKHLEKKLKKRNEKRA